MPHNLTFEPDFISPPGETLTDVLEERGMSQAELAERTGLSRKTVNEIIKGKAPISPETALHLERVFGIPARFWNAREHQYREALARLEEADELRRHAAWIDAFPYREMAALGFVPPVDGRVKDALERRGRALLDFFGVAAPEQWREVWLRPGVAFRMSLSFASHPEPVSAWLRYGQKTALEEIRTEPYDARTFRCILQEMRGLTTEPPEVFCDRLIAACAAAGVAVVLTPQLPKAHISGATQWLRPDLALIQLSFRYKTNDHFWFTFFHEAAHILLHGKKEVFLEDSDNHGLKGKEDEANRWAANFLVPEPRLNSFIARGDRSREAIVAFAREVGIAPGIVVGQLQHRGFIPYSSHNGLKIGFRWDKC
jgi:HTH-type transcriptional regulator / antitoxin HigA